MSFSRTSSGLSNMARFYGAEIVVFTEGGTSSFSAKEALEGNFNINSVDIKFWSIALRKYGFNKKVHFRALGSKTSAKEIALKAANKEIHNVLVARDADLDIYLQCNIDSPFVLHTYGYSWENDVWHTKSLLAQIETLCMSQNLPDECQKAVDETLAHFHNYARRLFLLELIYRKNGQRFITALTGEYFLNCRSQPALKMGSILKLLRDNKDKVARPVRVNSLVNLQDAVRFCYGKLFECLSYSVLCYVAKTHLGFKSIPKALITSTMIERFSALRDDDIDEYYGTMINNLRQVL
ncbi:DUF4435 domain-containing protein [Cronobacter turicensis]|nr:DUF4435 domain-containing protein [Cronobacter turicensis]